MVKAMAFNDGKFSSLKSLAELIHPFFHRHRLAILIEAIKPFHAALRKKDADITPVNLTKKFAPAFIAPPRQRYGLGA